MSALNGKSYIKAADLKNFLEKECRDLDWTIRRDYYAAFLAKFRKEKQSEEKVEAIGWEFKDWVTKEMNNHNHGKCLAVDAGKIFKKMF